MNLSDPSGLYSADSAERYLRPGSGYETVNAPWCEGGFGFSRIDDSNWRQADAANMATYAYVHTQELVDEGQLPVTTGDRLAPSMLDTAVNTFEEAVCTASAGGTSFIAGGIAFGGTEMLGSGVGLATGSVPGVVIGSGVGFVAGAYVGGKVQDATYDFLAEKC